jgi:hypothetical protein
MSPDFTRHEDATFQVPTASPPQADTLGQFSAPPVVLPVTLAPLLVEVCMLVLSPVLWTPVV